MGKILQQKIQKLKVICMSGLLPKFLNLSNNKKNYALEQLIILLNVSIAERITDYNTQGSSWPNLEKTLLFPTHLIPSKTHLF